MDRNNNRIIQDENATNEFSAGDVIKSKKIIFQDITNKATNIFNIPFKKNLNRKNNLIKHVLGDIKNMNDKGNDESLTNQKQTISNTISADNFLKLNGNITNKISNSLNIQHKKNLIIKNNFKKSDIMNTMEVDEEKKIQNNNQNVWDIFLANPFKSKRVGVTDIASKTTNILNIQHKKKLINKNNFKKRVFGDITNTKNTRKINFSSLTKKICVASSIKNNVEEKIKNIDFLSTKNNNIDTDKCNTGLIIKKTFDILSTSNDIYNESEFIISLNVPENSYNNNYTNNIVVAEPWKCVKLLTFEEKTALSCMMIETSKVESRILSVPCRKSCSPQEQYSVTPTLQYESKCLIKQYHSSSDTENNFQKAVFMDSINKLSRINPNESHLYMYNSINTSHFHDLYLEKLPCNQLHDFMPQNKELTGSILGGFINDIFELSQYINFSSEIIHTAVDYIYQYLSRVQDVSLNDLKLISLGAVWVASKYEGRQNLNQICYFTDCSSNQLKHAELRLLMVIDFNLTKPNAINFRNRFIVIESSTSTISHLSSFILDMTLHCYTVMILDASKRAAASLWLSRLIEKFEDIVRLSDDAFDLDSDILRENMDYVWPEYYQKLTGYHHSEIAQLAIKMHVVVLALLCRGQQNNPAINACYNIYSNNNYKNLTNCYEKFTSKIVYYGTELYCHLHNLHISEWLEKAEYDTLKLALTSSGYDNNKNKQDRHREEEEYRDEVISCPAEIMTSRPLIRRIMSNVEHKTLLHLNNNRKNNNNDSNCQHGDEELLIKGSKLVKMDSGYFDTDSSSHIYF